MGLFGFGKKKKRLEEEKRQIELAKQAEEARRAEQLKIEEEKKKELSLLQKKEEKKDKQVPKKPVEKKVEKKVNVEKKDKTIYDGPSGKYEVYPEADLFKFRLKASNGEVLAVSFGYSTRKGAKTGIDTFKNAVEIGNFEISTDKAGFSYFELFDQRKARTIVVGEFYKTLKSAESAAESVKNFARCENIIDLDEIPANEVREYVIEKQDIESNSKGKFQLFKEDSKNYYAKLTASNGQVLLVTQKYASKQSALNGIESIKKAVENQKFTIYKDKQNRYQFKLYTANKQLIVTGETYPQKANCLSSIQSVLRFAALAEVVEI